MNILITRPAHQARSLIQTIEAQGNCAIVFPTIEIVPLFNAEQIQRFFQQLQHYDWVVFISQNAVEGALGMDQRSYPQVFEGIQCVALGPGTAACLKRYGFSDPLLPDYQFDSEGLLKKPEFQDLNGKKILLVRGEGGRELLANTFRKRGAYLEEAIVYRRVLPRQSNLSSVNLKNIDIIICTSQTSLENLYQLFSMQSAELLQKQLLVSSHRLVNLVKSMGFVLDPILADNATDAAILKALFIR